MNDQDRSQPTLDAKDVQVNELTVALRETERKLKERDVLIAKATNQTEEARRQYEQSVERVELLRRRLDALEQQLDAMRSQLDAGNAELTAARESIAARDQKIASLEQEPGHSETYVAKPAPVSVDDDVFKIIDKAIERVDAADTGTLLTIRGYVLESPDQSGISHQIRKAVTTVGRVPSNDIVINSKSVSRHHARLVIQPEGVWLIDLRSSNGCTVNGRLITGQLLCDGDEVVVGECKFTFLVRELSKSAEDQALDETMPLLDEALFLYAAAPKPKESSNKKRDKLD